MPTLTITNFKGSMTPYINGDVNSGLAYVQDVFGYDPFTHPGVLRWNEQAELVDPTGSVITDFILAGKSRMESGTLYVYAIGHTGRLYKIQVNNTATYNPNYDNPVLVTTLSSGSPTFTRGAFMEFYGATEQIYIGHDKGVTKINFDGSGEAVVGVAGSWTQTVPRPFAQFLGNLYAGNGANIAEILSGGTVSSYAKLSPGFPVSTQVRDMDVTSEGNYLQVVTTELALSDVTATTPPTSIIAPSNSYLFKWNGTDTGYTAMTTYPNTALSANLIFGDYQYLFGYDFLGGGIYNPSRKVLTSTPNSTYGDTPLPNSVIAQSNMFSIASTLPYAGHLEMLISTFGTISEFEIEPGYWSTYGQTATAPETDVNRVGCQILVSNFGQGTSYNGYTSQIFGVPKVYFSTLETSDSTTDYRLYKWSPVPTGLGDAISGGIYQTQTQLFSKKVTVNEVRVYSDPWVANNGFTIDLIGPGDNIISGGSFSFDSDTTLIQGTSAIGKDFLWYNPQIAPTYGIGVRITNDDVANYSINKIEIDYSEAGK